MTPIERVFINENPMLQFITFDVSINDFEGMLIRPYEKQDELKEKLELMAI